MKVECRECGAEINDDDRRWNQNPETVYCRECVAGPVFEAKTKEERFAALKRGREMAAVNRPQKKQEAVRNEAGQ